MSEAVEALAAQGEVLEIQGGVDGLADFELDNLPRSRAVTYALTLPPDYAPDNPAKGLVFYIPGFGEDNAAEYMAKIRRHIAENFRLAAVSVDYHAIHARPDQGCQITIEPADIQRLMLLAEHHHVPFQGDNLMATLQAVGSKLPSAITLKASLDPPNNEYQNFGVLQALDHLSVLNDLITEGIAFDHNNIIAFGSSHGGFIAHLIAKFAPSSINAVIDNSSYIRAPMTYLGLYPEYRFSVGNCVIACNVKTLWQLGNRNHLTFFGLAQQLVRETSFPPHLETMKQNAERMPRYFCFNSIIDGISPISEKRLQIRRFQEQGIDVDFKEITEADIDGKLFKVLDHGMNASMKGICNLILPKIAPRPTTLDRFRQTVLDYDGYDQTYRIAHLGEAAPWIEASLSKA